MSGAKAGHNRTSSATVIQWIQYQTSFWRIKHRRQHNRSQAKLNNWMACFHYISKNCFIFSCLEHRWTRSWTCSRKRWTWSLHHHTQSADPAQPSLLPALEPHNYGRGRITVSLYCPGCCCCMFRTLASSCSNDSGSSNWRIASRSRGLTQSATALSPSSLVMWWTTSGQASSKYYLSISYWN